MEVEVRAVRFVRKDAHPRRVRDLHDLAEVGADAVVRRVVDEDRLRARMLRDRLLDVLDAHAERNAETPVDAGVDVHRDRAADDERVDGAPVDVAREYYLVPGGAGRHYHRLHRGRRAVHHEERVVRPERLRRELLRLLDHGDGMPQVVERLHRVYVHRERPLAEVLGELGVAAAALVRRHVEVREPVYALAVKRVRERRLALPCPCRISCCRRYGSCHLIYHLV